jgi:hypothetical protein
MQRRSVEIREGLEIMRLDPNWTLPSRMGENPLVWMVRDENGLIVDIRSLPRHEQVKAFEAGLIPYIPADAGEPMDLGVSPEAFAAFMNELGLEESCEPFEEHEVDDLENPVIGRIGPEDS